MYFQNKKFITPTPNQEQYYLKKYFVQKRLWLDSIENPVLRNIYSENISLFNQNYVDKFKESKYAKSHMKNLEEYKQKQELKITNLTTDIEQLEERLRLLNAELENVERLYKTQMGTIFRNIE
jgi:hypothetical protein